MRKITPVMLVLLLVASLMANIDIAQLETNEVVEDTGARSGADVDLVAITSPKETVCEPTCRNELFVGQDTSFEVFIQNSGDAAITELGYKAQVWNADGNGNPLNIAIDSNGADLEWDNPDVICDDTTVCDDQSLAAGDVFKGGKTMIQYGGSNAVWTPIAGIYVVQIEVYSDQDVEATNDVQQVYVEVRDYLDIEVDISWDDGSTVATGEGAKAFTVTVELNGSSDFITHNLTMLLDVNGDVASATAEDGTDLVAASLGSLVHSVNVGNDMPVLVFENGSDPSDNLTEIRTVMSDNTNNGIWEYKGSVLPDTGGTDAAYSIDVELGGYSLYGQFESCQEVVSVNSTDAEGNEQTTTETYNHFCEEASVRDDITNNNRDEITGALSTFHDIRISMLTVNQGYNSDGTGIATYTVGAGEPGDLSVGTSYVDASVEHRGSSVTELYDWNVTFTITNLDTSEVITSTVNECVEGVEPSYNHAMLGNGPMAFTQGHACTMVEFDVGTYTIEANLVMEDKTTDQKLSNNLVTMEKEVRNNLPVVSSLDLVTQGDLMLGMENMLEFEVSVFDADDVTGEGLTYTWVGGATSTPLAGCGGQGGVGRTCSTPVIQEFVTTFPVKVTVTDAHGGAVTEEIIIEIWNDAVASDTTTAGVTMDYSITYFSKAAFTIDVEDGDATSCQGITLPDSSGGELSGVYTPVAVIDYNPVTTYAANDVLAQSMDMVFDSSLGASSLWFTTNCNSATLTQLLADGATNSEDDSTKSVLSAVLSGPVLPAGQFLLIDAPLQSKDAPSASISGFSANAEYNGGISMNWGTTGTMLSDEKFSISVANDADSDVFEIDLASDQFMYTYSDTAHGVSYTIDIAVCNNDGLCSTPVGTATVVADKEVDGGAAATAVTVTEAGDKWTLSWETTGDLADVAVWHVCSQNRESFTAAEMPSNCVPTADADTLTADVMMGTSPGQYTVYFVVVPVDALGNKAYAASNSESGADASYFKENAGGTTDTNSTDGDDKESGELPGWTWGAIGGVVVVAFIAGAFILSRGGNEGEDKDWDY
tara:strand:+ start:2686 stop:5832 length:3147 start_codon:yes stop_codon:yes gene_type:complete